MCSKSVFLTPPRGRRDRPRLQTPFYHTLRSINRQITIWLTNASAFVELLERHRLISHPLDFGSRSAWSDTGWFPMQGTSPCSTFEGMQADMPCRALRRDAAGTPIWGLAWLFVRSWIIVCLYLWCMMFVCYCTVITQIDDHNWYKFRWLFILPSLDYCDWLGLYPAFLIRPEELIYNTVELIWGLFYALTHGWSVLPV